VKACSLAVAHRSRRPGRQETLQGELLARAKLAPHLNLENREDILKRAAHKSRREIEELLAELSPRPDAPAVMRKLPDRRDGTARSDSACATSAPMPQAHDEFLHRDSGGTGPEESAAPADPSRQAI
jgi:hypothetical protein